MSSCTLIEDVFGKSVDKIAQDGWYKYCETDAKLSYQYALELFYEGYEGSVGTLDFN